MLRARVAGGSAVRKVGVDERRGGVGGCGHEFDGVAADENALLRKETRAGIPDEIDSLLQVGDAAKDVRFLLPEARRFPCNFVGGVVVDAVEDGTDLRAEVGVESADDSERHGADAVVGLNSVNVAGVSLAGLRSTVAIGDGNARVGLANAIDDRAVANDGVEARRERVGNAVHAAHRL